MVSMEIHKKEVLIIGFVVLIFLVLEGSQILNGSIGSCYKDKAVLHNQRVGELKGYCENCLIFNVTEFVCKGQPGDGCGCEWEDKILYFADEQHIRNDLKNGQEIWINWCWLEEIKDYRVRGIEGLKKL